MDKKIKIFIKFIGVFVVCILFYHLYRYVSDDGIRSFNSQFYGYAYKSSISSAFETLSTGNKKVNLEYNNKSVPVLMYHSIGQAKFNPYVVSPTKFQEDMEYLKDNNYNTLSIDDFYRFIVDDEPIPQKSVLITFDDGYQDNYTQAYPILKKLGFKATIFVITGYLNKGNMYLTTDELLAMEKNGIDIESHTVKHDKLGKETYSEQLNTLKESKSFLENLFNKKIEFLSYPFDSYNINTLKADKDAGYKMAFTTDGKWTSKGNGLLTLNRVFISGFHSENSFKTRVNTSSYIFTELYF
jgi:peptidoglycan/xylan/chitin deacetylase (PgdA/CDA1 family)